VAVGDVFTLFAGTAGGASDGSTGGPGGTNADGYSGGEDGDVLGGGGGAASTVELDGDPYLSAFGGDGAGADPDNSYGIGGGGDDNAWSAGTLTPSQMAATTTGTGNGTVQLCPPPSPDAPYLNAPDSADGALILNLIDQSTGAGDVPAVSYEYTRNGGSTWAALTTSTRDGRIYATVSGLTNGTVYTIQVRAVGGRNTAPSAPSQAVQGKPSKKAGAPTGVEVATAVAALTVSWGQPTARTYPITGYRVELVSTPGEHGRGTEFCETGATVLTCTAPVESGVTHDVVVYTLDGDGQQGEWSARVTSGVVPSRPPSPPRTVT
jgi:hypothetical protein